MSTKEHILLDAPWGLMHPESEDVGIGRPCLMIRNTVTDMRCPRIRCSLSYLGTAERNGQTWSIYELPSIATPSEKGYAREELAFTFREKSLRGKIPSIVSIGLPHPIASADITSTEHDPWQAAGIKTMAILDSHLEWVNSLYDEVTRPHWENVWEGQAEGTAVRNLSCALKRWRESGPRDEPRFSLIIRLERDRNFQHTLESVCSRPRKILTRYRTIMSISRIQEVDPACIRWLVRQPGVSLAQKAGPRQEAMGIVRVENTDTLENRVIRDLLLRASNACSLYLQENRHFSKHDRVWRIRRFRRELRQKLKYSEIASARSLIGHPNPNYVLQHDPRYSLLWGIYLLLVRQQKQQDDVWRWRQRTWAEHVSLAFLASLEEYATAKSFEHADIFIRGEQINGTFVDIRCDIPAIPVLRSGKSCWVDFVRRDQLEKYPFTPDGLLGLSPDFMISVCPVNRGKPISTLAIWTILDFDLDNTHSQKYFDSLQNTLQRIVDISVKGLIIRPLAPEIETPNVLMDSCANLAAMPMQLQSSQDKIIKLIREFLKLDPPEHV